MERVEVTTVAKARQNRDELASDLLNLLENRRKEAFRHGAKTREAEADQIEVVRMAYNHATDVLNRLEDEERQRAGARQAEAALQLSTCHLGARHRHRADGGRQCRAGCRRWFNGHQRLARADQQRSSSNCGPVCHDQE